MCINPKQNKNTTNIKTNETNNYIYICDNNNNAKTPKHNKQKTNAIKNKQNKINNKNNKIRNTHKQNQNTNTNT